MSNQFKSGDQVLTLVSKYQIPAMSEVELVIFRLKGQKAEEPDGQLWVAPYDGWIVGRDGEDGYGFFKPGQLMLLHGDFTLQQQKAKEAEPCA
ncbi:hypothetical protein FHW68_000641 [Pseudomonas sp. Tn43]|uniref:hypothetical protein n=1 Tax=Pseudomonas sp. Tn43 TaxID=701213 RepID=UPI001616352B|nr:hypothetical protein [Pseudomonas sp. Tn43]MBB3239169.1 hypothetical protein [Pseudomonas sp. Tn43]